MLRILFLIILLTGCTSETERRQLPEYAPANFSNPDSGTGYTKIRIPWGYVAPDVSYQDESELKKLIRLARILWPNFELNKPRDYKRSKDPRITRVFSIEALLPNIEPKSYSNIDEFNKGGNKFDNRLRVLVRSANRIDNKPINKNVNVQYKSSIDDFFRRVGKRGLNYHQGEEHGLSFYKVTDEVKNKIRASGNIEASIPDGVFYTRVNNDAQRVLSCQDEFHGYVCIHDFYLDELNARIHLSYHARYIKDWQKIEDKVKERFREFIALGENYRTSDRK